MTCTTSSTPKPSPAGESVPVPRTDDRLHMGPHRRGAPTVPPSERQDAPMARFVRLSYEISPTAPGWPGTPTYRWEQVSSIAGGDVANLGVLHLCDHFGT